MYLCVHDFTRTRINLSLWWWRGGREGREGGGGAAFLSKYAFTDACQVIREEIYYDLYFANILGDSL